ncbi:MAG: electron transfer flavoprotein subunit beta/FixA family protein [Synergistaceae bacterium]|jgi:electron transfer flavoprotein beta subunit|nr:electron transfer flavoprotein subunit beta/FixA family protein [Synergistaceae bacterium]
MNIAVCIKQVPVSNNVSVDPVTHVLVRDSAENMLNPADANALEEAVSLKERYGGKVVAFTMGPPAADKALRTAAAMGADELVLITDRVFAGADTLATAKALAESVRRCGAFDLILTGSESSDGATGQVGPMVAECLTLPHLTEVRSVEALEAGCLRGVKKFKNSGARVSVRLPAVLTLSYGCNDPRLPTFSSQIAAKKKTVIVHTNEDLALPEDAVGLSGSPTEVVDSFEPEKKKNAAFLSGSSAEIAEKILTLIQEKKGTGKKGADNG